MFIVTDVRIPTTIANEVHETKELINDLVSSDISSLIEIKGFKVDGEIYSTPVKVKTSGVYIIFAIADFCGASNTSVPNPYVVCSFYIDDILSNTDVFRQYINIPIHKTWDNAAVVSFTKILYEGQYVKMRFENKVGIASEPNYNSLFGFNAFRLR